MKIAVVLLTLSFVDHAFSEVGKTPILDSRIICQEYPIKEKKSILVFEYTTQGLVETSDMTILGVDGAIKTYDNFIGKNIFQSPTSEKQNYNNSDEIIEKLTKPSIELRGRVFQIANRYFIFKGIFEVLGKDGKKIRDENWEISFDPFVQQDSNSTLVVLANGKRILRSFKCRPEEKIKVEQAGTVSPSQAQCLADTGSVDCATHPTNQ